MSLHASFKPDFQRYLQAKRTVDDRALNRVVWEELINHLPANAHVIEIACGVGTMLNRLYEWGTFNGGETYLGVDLDAASIEAARNTAFRFDGAIEFHCSDVLEMQPDREYDLLIATAFLDLLPLEMILPKLLGFLKPGGLAYFPIHFDGLTFFEPPHPADMTVLGAYHASMDTRPSGGHSQTGRQLFEALPMHGFEMLAAGASDWIVYPFKGEYAHDEAYFLRHILSFFEQSCADTPGLPDWLDARLDHLAQRKLTFSAHQFDFLVKRPETEEFSG